MRHGAILVNTARGALLDEAALVDALNSGKVAHAGLDVFTVEPLPARHPFTTLPNVTLSAHSAFRTPESSVNLVEAALAHCRRIAADRGEAPMTSSSLARWLAALGASIVLIAGTACAADVHVMISAGFFGVYSELAPAFERASGHRLLTTRGPSMGDSPESIPTRLARGEPADVVILDGGAADELGKRGLVRADSKVELARSLIGMVVRAGAAKPDIGSVEAFRSALLAAKSIAYSDSGSGTYLSTTLFPKLGVAEQLAGKSARCVGRRRASRWRRLSRVARRRSASSRSAS